MKIGGHQYFSNILNEYYPIICPEYTIHYYGLEENKSLFNKINQKYYSPEYDLFRTVTSKFEDIFIMSDLYLLDDEMPSFTLVIKNIEGYENTEIYFSVSLLAKCYCFFIKTKDGSGVTYYFDPFFHFTDLYNQVEEVIKEIFNEFIQIPFIWLRYQLKYTIPGVTHFNKEDGELLNHATIFDALFYPFDFNSKRSTVMHNSSSDYNIFEMLDKSDPELIERYNFFKKDKNSVLKPI